MNDTKEIPLTKGHVAIVDEADYEWLTRRTCYSNGKYAMIYIGKGDSVPMHRAILNPLPGFEVDHINGNKLDNRRCNLRICTRTENACNISKSKFRGSSPYKGLQRQFDHRPWKVSITCNGKLINLGTFTSEVEAAHAYDVAALKYHGAFAYPNFPTEAAYLAALAQEQSR